MNNSPRLISFGCSLTYGHGLPDCHVAPSEPGIIPSDYAWPEILANKIGAECVNMSEPGSSNKRIWHTIINFDFKETDIVFVLWAAVDRTCILRTPDIIEDIGPWMDDLGYYQNYHSDYDAELQTRLYISHANLTRPGIRNLITAKKHEYLLSLCGNTVNHVPVYLRNYVDKYPLALDNIHPGVECHRVYAEEICKLI